MLLLMRRVGETIRINEAITIQITQIKKNEVTFIIEGLDSEDEIKQSLKGKQKEDV